jgi:hypothetical protein
MLGELLVKQRDTNSAFRAIQSGDRLSIVLAAAYLDGEFRDEYFQSNRKCPTHGTWRERGAGTAPIVEPDQYFKFVPDKELVIWQDSVKLEEAKNILSFDPCFFGDGFSSEYAYRAVLDWMKSTDVKGQAISEFFIIVVDFVRPYDSFKTLDKYNMEKLHEAANRASLAYRPYYIGTFMQLDDGLVQVDSLPAYKNKEQSSAPLPPGTPLELRFRVYGAGPVPDMVKLVDRVKFSGIEKQLDNIKNEKLVAERQYETLSRETDEKLNNANQELTRLKQELKDRDRFITRLIWVGVGILLVGAMLGVWSWLALKARRETTEHYQHEIEELKQQADVQEGKERELRKTSAHYQHEIEELKQQADVQEGKERELRKTSAHYQYEIEELKQQADVQEGKERELRKTSEQYQYEIEELKRQMTVSRFCLPERG